MKVHELSSIASRMIPNRAGATDTYAHYRSTMVVAFTLSTLVWAPIFAVLNYAVLGQPILGHLSMLALLLGGIVLAVLRFSRSFWVAGQLLTTFFLMEMMLIFAWTGGLLSPTAIWVAGVPMVATLLSGRVSGFCWTVVVAAFTATQFLMHQYGRMWPSLLDEEGTAATQALSLVGTQILAYSLCYCFDAIRRRAEQSILVEQTSLRQLLHRQEVERQLLGYDIHDGLTQMLAGAAMHLDMSRDALPADSPVHSELEQASTLLRRSLVEARRVIAGLRPAVLEEHGLVAAIEELITQSKDLAVRFEHHLLAKRMSPLLETSLFRICQEALANAAKYAGGASVEVDLVQNAHSLVLTIRDRGTGFDPEEVGSAGFGLEGIRQRARFLGGQSKIESNPGKGTCVCVELPLSVDDD